MERAPLVSCLMVTRGDLAPARFAIECYRSQTYTNRELIIVCDRPESPLSSFLEELADPSIKFCPAARMVLGDLRNASVGAASGALLCQWDDDDLFHPRRLEYQVATLLQSGAAAHFLERWLVWWPARGSLGISDSRIWEGSMMIRREALPPYSPITRFEDTLAVAQIRNRSTISVTDFPELYCYTVNGGNTWDETHFEQVLQDCTLLFLNYEDELRGLSRDFPIADYAGWLEDSKSSRWSRRPAKDPFIIQDRTFGEESAGLDGVYYSGCTFNGTTLIHFGGPIGGFDRCTFNNVSFKFEASAKPTFEVVKSLVRMGALRL
jgi:glycosyltransferase involved in cell wall biosynthesis